MARQTFLAATPLAGEFIDSFITHLQKLAEHCDYKGEGDNQVRDRAISFLEDKNLKSKLYREETLTLSKLTEILSKYHVKEALILIPKSQVNSLSSDPKQGGKCWRCHKVGHFAKNFCRSRDHKCGKCGHMGHFEVCCHFKHHKGCGRGNLQAKPNRKRRGRNSEDQRDVHNMTGNTSAEKRVSNDKFYMFSARKTDGQSTTPNANMADLSVVALDESHEIEASEAQMFCFDSTSPGKSCFVVDLVYFVSPSRTELNLPQ